MRSHLSIGMAAITFGLVVLTACVAGPSKLQETPTMAAGDAPDQVRMVRDAVLIHLQGEYGERAPLADLSWVEERTTPEGLVGSESFRLTSGEWEMAVSYPVVALDATVYTVVVTNRTTGFSWEGEVDASGQVAAGSDAAEPTVLVPGPTNARDEILAYIGAQYGQETPSPDVLWEEERLTPEGLVGSETFQYRDGGWVVTVSFPVVALENVIYQVLAVNHDSGFEWQGEIGATGQITETSEEVACWYGHVEQASDSSATCLILPAEQTRLSVGVVGVDEAIEAEIAALLESGEYAHFWGGLNCNVHECGGCRLVVSQLLPEGSGSAIPAPVLVDGWTGTIHSLVEGAQFDDYFIHQSPLSQVRFGIESLDDAVAAQLARLRDTASIIRVWGQVSCPAADFQGTQIQVEQVDVIMDASARSEGYDGWNPYLNERVGYSLWYPGTCAIESIDLDSSVTFVGPVVDGEYWPVLSVSHHDSDLYRPPVGVDIRQWFTDFGFTFEESEIQVAGLTTLHHRDEGGPQSYSSDQYYFLHGDQVFVITFSHAGYREDWELYTKFLEGFAFLDLP